MNDTPDAETAAINLLRTVSESGFGIISAIQAQARALDELISLVTTNPQLDQPGAAATLDLLRQAQQELDGVYEMAVDATVATWSITALPPSLDDPPSNPDSDETPGPH
ncbi:MAG: hypothetical protein ACRDT4_17370 [Micromonosporaceae bacterium]